MIVAAVDIETKDPHLKQWGPGACRGDGKILSVGIYSPELAVNGYFQPTDAVVIDILKRVDVVKVFHNGVYDLDWLINGYHLEVNGRCEDTMTRETLLDAYAMSYSLDSCCARRGVEGKNKSDTIEAWWESQGRKGKAIEHLDEVPPVIVGKYCVQDCKATYDLFFAQQPLLDEQNLLRANDIECGLYPLLMNMKGNGIRVDTANLIKLSDMFMQEYEEGMRELERTYGFAEDELSLNSGACLERIWKQEKLPVEYTSTGRPSFSAEVLDECTHPVAEKIHHLRGLVKSQASSVAGWICASMNTFILVSILRNETMAEQ